MNRLGVNRSVSPLELQPMPDDYRPPILPDELLEREAGSRAKKMFAARLTLPGLEEDRDQDIERRRKLAQVRGEENYQNLRVCGAAVVTLLLIAVCAFTVWLVHGVGTPNELDFSGSETFLNIIAGDVVITVLGIVAILMRFLYPSAGVPTKEKEQNNSNALVQAVLSHLLKK